MDLEGNVYGAGDFEEPFSIQSISKVRAQADFIETAVVPGISGIGDIGTGINRNRALTMRLLLSLDITQEGETFETIRKLREEILSLEKPYEASIFDAQERRPWSEGTASAVSWSASCWVIPRGRVLQ
mgnify:CR=1 FL=1